MSRRTPARARLVRAIAIMALAAGCSSQPAPPTGSPDPPPTGPAPPPPEEPGPTPPEQPATPPLVPEVLVGAGDIAGCASGYQDEATASLLDGIEGTVFTLGDNVYDDATAEAYAECYDPTWGRHKARTHPAAGNHEYNSPGAQPYYDYWGEQAGPAGKGYYSYDLGDWHIVVLNSAAGVGEQAAWLADDLAAHPRQCTLAYWHHSYFTSGKHRGRPEMRPVVEVLYDAGADVMLTAHSHNYERFAPQRPDSTADEERGIRAFVVGTGGANTLYNFDADPPNTEVRRLAYGVLKLGLYPDRYTWEFVPVAGEPFTDSGEGPCH